MVNKTIDKIGFKDEITAFSEEAMFRPQDFVLARIILDVYKPLLDSVSINIFVFKKVKVYIFYEKIAERRGVKSQTVKSRGKIVFEVESRGRNVITFNVYYI